MYQLIVGDCVEEVAKLPDDSVDLFMFSPPYDRQRRYGGYLKIYEDGFVFPIVPLFKEIKRTMKPSGLAVMVIDDSTINQQRTLTVHKAIIKIVEEVGLMYHDMYIYKRPPSPGESRKRNRNWFEYVPTFKKSKNIKFNLDAVRVPYSQPERTRRNIRVRNIDDSIKIGHYYKGQHPLGRDPGNVIECYAGYMLSTKDKIAFKHPAIYPEKLCEFFILLYTDPGDLVVDPMVGSGTTCKVAIKHGRRAIGIDINPEYIEIARKRMEMHYGGATLFEMREAVQT